MNIFKMGLSVIKALFTKKKSKKGYYDPYLDQWVEYKKCNPDTDI